MRSISITVISLFQNIMSFYDLEILAELQCPVCLEYMHPPIRQCQTGHSMCDKCFARVACCPVCRAPKSYTRSLALEILQTRMVFPCRNLSEGCQFIDLGPYISEHEDCCPFGAVPCTLKPVTNCSWCGPISRFLNHATLNHPGNVFLNTENTIVCNDFLNENQQRTKNWFHNIFVIDYQVFKCVFDVDYESGMMRWCIFYIGIERSARDYTYEIIIENSNDPSEKVVIKATCKDYKQEETVFSKNLCMFTNYHVLKRFCNGQMLSFNVKLSSRNKL